jgi:NhaA family Na+:H+ antiporter
LTRATLDPELRWLDVFGLALLAGIGFTVALLIGDLAFGFGSTEGEHVKVAVLAGSVTASVLAAVILKSRDRAYRRIEEAASLESA